jgi:amino acid transporter
MPFNDDDDYRTEKSFGSGRKSQSSYYGESSVQRDGLGRRVLDSFKRDPAIAMTPKGTVGTDGKVFDVESAAANTANSPLARRLKGRHLQMIAIGGSIGEPGVVVLRWTSSNDHQERGSSWDPARCSPPPARLRS